jgi:hypothetical protein
MPVKRFAVEAQPWLLVVLLSIAFRWPALINAGTVNSDAAIVGLQAMHIPRGELSLLLYGSGYQTSVDSFVAAGFFALFGASPLALMLSTFAGHVASTLLAYSTLARHLPRWSAAVAVLPLVFTPSPLHTYILGPPRQAAITLVFLAVWWIDRVDVGSAARGRGWRFGGGVVASLACFADPYALLFLPPFLVLTLVLSWRPGSKGGSRWVAVGRGVLPVLAGLLVGIAPFLLLLSSPRSVHGEATFTASVLRHNAGLLWEVCLPWVTSARVFLPGDAGYVPWNAGAFRTVQVAGPILLLGAMTLGLFSFFRASPSDESRRLHLLGLGLYGLAVLVLNLAAFLVSPMVMDLFSARYLAAMVLMAPFALAPAAARVNREILAGLLAPYLVSAMASGWLGFGREVKGLFPVRLASGGASDEERLQVLLRERGVEHAIADYWVAYRLTFLYREAIEVVPLHPEEDRYAPYRRAFDSAKRVAYVFDARRSREQLESMREELATHGAYGAIGETLRSGDLTAIVLFRP